MSDPVLIVGAGPTGLMAALELSAMNIPVRLIEKAREPATTSRAIGVQARTLELLDQRGLAQELISRGTITRHGNIHGGGKRLIRLDFAHVHSRFPYMLFVSQVETEDVLRSALAKRGISVEWGTELIGIAQDLHDAAAEKAQVVLRDADGELSEVHAPWVISAEGAHSLVRKTFDLPFKGKTLEEQFALGDFDVDGLEPEELYIFSSEQGFLGMFPLGGGRFRLIASDPPKAANLSEPPSLAMLQRIFGERARMQARFHDMTWSSWFRINSRMVEKLRVGRFLLGGDAAHIHSPAGAQGMNTGLQDMANLCWKLALVIRGEANESLLDSYAEERLPVMHDVLFMTEHLTEAIASESHVFRTLFNHIGPLIGAREIVQENATARMSQVGIHYRPGPLSEEHVHDGSLHAGDRLPDLSVRVAEAGGLRACRLFELLDPTEFTVLVTHPAAGAELMQAEQPFHRIFQIESGAPEDHLPKFDTLFGRSHARVILVRPDGYVAFVCPAQGGAEWLTRYARDRLAMSRQTSPEPA